VSVITTWALILLSRSTPPENDEIVRVSRTTPVAASLIGIRSLRPQLSRLVVDNARLCAWPSVVLAAQVTVDWQERASKTSDCSTCALLTARTRTGSTSSVS